VADAPHECGEVFFVLPLSVRWARYIITVPDDNHQGLFMRVDEELSAPLKSGEYTPAAEMRRTSRRFSVSHLMIVHRIGR